MIPITGFVLAVDQKCSTPPDNLRFPSSDCLALMTIGDLLLTITTLVIGILGITSVTSIPSAASYSLIGIGSFIALGWLVGLCLEKLNQRNPSLPSH